MLVIGLEICAGQCLGMIRSVRDRFPEIKLLLLGRDDTDEQIRELVDQGLEAEGSYFVSSTEDWAVYSMLITVPDLPAEDALATMQEAHAACAAKGQAMPELELGEGRWGYRSEGEGTTDAMRGYAVVGEHELAQVTVFGLQDQEPPSDPSVEQLLDKAVERAGE